MEKTSRVKKKKNGKKMERRIMIVNIIRKSELFNLVK